jgi:hypothetical protein
LGGVSLEHFSWAILFDCIVPLGKVGESGQNRAVEYRFVVERQISCVVLASMSLTGREMDESKIMRRL